MTSQIPHHTQHIQTSAALQPKYGLKRYTIRTQAMLISVRKDRVFRVQRHLSDYDLCQALLPLLDSTKYAINDSINTLSDKFQAQLREDKVVGLPDCFFPLQGHDTLDRQSKAAAPSLGYLKNIGIISKTGDCDEERLEIVAEVCGKLCYKNCFELPADLDDTRLPDLLAKFAIMEEARLRQKASLD